MKDYDEIKELNELIETNSLDEVPVNQSNMNCMDEKFNSDLYDTN